MSLPSFLEERTEEPKPASSDLKEVNKANEIQLIKNVLLQTHFNKTKAAKILNIDRTTLYEKIKKYELEILSDKS
ncbi:helix-turn-helix domain-containing protein [Marinoscillum sp.]|uniref:helix-turn-helix domain-containing protein n=1 Tax=Marinoscillum sp. TaxID=2024838 RepID=UPI003BABEF88